MADNRVSPAASRTTDAAGLTRLSATLSQAPARSIGGRRDFEDVALAVANVVTSGP
ncbi:hypothetical protein MAHJHV57_54750 [Mycobacterium avium subsp. hominissuis]